MKKNLSTHEKIVEDMRNEQTEGYAGFFTRTISLIIDLTLLIIVAEYIGSNEILQDGTIGFKLDSTGSLVFFLYFLLLEWSPLKGTVGKLLLGIKVCDEYGARLSFGKSFLRCISRVVTFFTLFLGFFTIIFRNDNRALHDFMSNTYVLIKKRKKRVLAD